MCICSSNHRLHTLSRDAITNPSSDIQKFFNDLVQRFLLVPPSRQCRIDFLSCNHANTSEGREIMAEFAKFTKVSALFIHSAVSLMKPFSICPGGGRHVEGDLGLRHCPWELDVRRSRHQCVSLRHLLISAFVPFLWRINWEMTQHVESSSSSWCLARLSLSGYATFFFLSASCVLSRCRLV